MSILDTRADTPRQLSLSGWRADVFERYGDKPRTADRIRESLQATAPLTEQEVADFLDSCVAQRLMVTEGGRYFLSLPGNGNW